jgi:hypothetical protein
MLPAASEGSARCHKLEGGQVHYLSSNDHEIVASGYRDRATSLVECASKGHPSEFLRLHIAFGLR